MNNFNLVQMLQNFPVAMQVALHMQQAAQPQPAQPQEPQQAQTQQPPQAQEAGGDRA